jgi:hypothetical protein
MEVRATIFRLSSDTDTREDSGLLMGITIAPFATIDENNQPLAYGSSDELVPR